MIDQLLLEMISSLEPVLAKIHGEVASYDHSSTIRHESSCIHVSHESINQRHASTSLSPSLNNLLVILPSIVSAIVDSIRVKDLVSMAEAPIPIEVSPE